MKKYLLIFILLPLYLGTLVAYADNTATTGFVPGQIWYSKETLIAGETVYIHTALWNGGDKDISARVEFHDKNIILGSRDVFVPKSELKDVSISWKVTAGDHIISAKITSSNTSTDGKAEKVTLSRSSTTESRQFVQVNVQSVDGVPASSADVVKNQVAKTTAEIQNVIPSGVDEFRVSTYTSISAEKDKTVKEIDAFSKSEKSTSPKTAVENKPLDGVQKPIAYVKLFLLSVAGFIFGTQIVFYGLCALLAFFILRFIYRKIRNR